MWFLNDEWTFHPFLVLFFLNALQKVSGMQNTETPGRNILARFDPRPAGVHVEGWGCHNVSNTGIFCPLFPCLKQVSLIVKQGLDVLLRGGFGQLLWLPTGGNSFSSSRQTGPSANSCSGMTSPFWAPPSSE